MKGEGYKPTVGGNTDKMHQGVNPSRTPGEPDRAQTKNGGRKKLAVHTKSIIQALKDGIDEHENSKKSEWSINAGLDRSGVERYREVLRRKGKVMQDDMDKLSREEQGSEAETISGIIPQVEEDILGRQELLQQQGFTPDLLSSEGKEVFNALTSEDIESVLHAKGGSPRIVEFLRKGLGYEVVSVNGDGDPSFLDKEGYIVVLKGNNTTFRVKPFEVWNLLRTAWIENHRDGAKAVGLFDPVDAGKGGDVTAEEAKQTRDRFFADDDGDVEVDEGTYDQVNNVFRGARPPLSVKGEELEKTLDLGEGSDESSSDDTESGKRDLPDDLDETQDLEQDEDKKGVISRITDTLEDVDLDSTQPEDWRTIGRAGDSEYHEMDEFVEQMAGLGLRVIREEGDTVTFQAEMPGAPIQTERKSELLKFINGEEEPEPIEVPVVPPRVEEETDAHGSNLHELSTKREGKERVLFFEERFTHEFGITKEDLMGIEGFRFLSKEQQKLVYENFVQCTLGSVHSEAVRLTQSAALEKRAALAEKLTPFIGNMVASFRDALTNKYSTLNREKDVLEQMRTGGFALHEELLTELVTHIAKFGPRVHETPEGELVVDLVNIRERAHNTEEHPELRGEEWRAMKDLNEKGHAFAQIPASWRGQTLGIDEESEWKVVGFLRKKFFGQKDHEHEIAYAKAEKEYTEAKTALEAILGAKGMNDLQIAEMIMQIDARVTSLQTLQTNPDALLELSEIEKRSTPQLAKEAALEFIKGPGTYMTLGIGLRSLSAALGFIGAPIGSAAIASLRSWNRTDAELRERDRNATTGTKDTKEGALNVNDAVELTKKTQYLLDRCRNASEEKKPALLAQLRARAEYIHDKQKLNHINYGERNGMITRQTLLMEAVAEAYTYLTAESMTEDAMAHTNVHFSESRERLDTQLKKTEAVLIASRKKGRQTDLLVSAGKAAAISTAAAYVVDLYHEWRADALATQTLTSGPQTAFKGDVPFVPTPVIDSTVDSLTGVKIETSVPVRDLPEELIPRSVGIGALSGNELDSGTFNNSPRIETDAMVEAEIERLQDEIRVVDDQIDALKTGTYTIKSGDTLTKILREQIPEIKELSTPEARRSAVAEFLAHLKLKPEELREIGVTSESINKIRAGDTLNIAKLREMVSVDRGLSDADVATTPSASAPVSETTPSGFQGETERGAMEITEPRRPGQMRPGFLRSALSSDLATPRAEVAPPATVPNNVVELSPARQAKVMHDRIIETLKIKNAGPGVSGRFFSDIEEHVRSHSRENSEVLTGMRNAIRAEEVLSKSKLHLEYRTNETVGEFMKRAGKEIARLPLEEQNVLIEKMTPKAVVVPQEISTPPRVEETVPAKPPVRPPQIRPEFPEEDVSLERTEQLPVEPESTPEAPKVVELVKDLPSEKISLGFKNAFIEGKIPRNDWVEMRRQPASTLFDVSTNVLKDPTVTPSFKKLVLLRDLVRETTEIRRIPNETIEEYFARADEMIKSGKVSTRADSLDTWMLRYDDEVRRIDESTRYDNQPRDARGRRMRFGERY
jgi:hypothetical protein